MPSYLPYLIVGLVVVCGIYAAVALTHQKNVSSQFAGHHPDAATVWLTSAKGAVGAAFAAGDILAVVGVDGVYVNFHNATDVDTSSANLVVDRQRAKDLFMSGGGKITIVPGQHTLALAAQHSRPGVLSKTVTTTYGPFVVNVNLEPHKDYQLTFDRDSQQFGLVERAA